MKTILITGANGFLGKALCEKLIESYMIIPVTRTIGDLDWIFKSNKVDYIIHAATFYGRGYAGSTDFIKSNILLPLQVCEYGIEHGVKAFINTDTFMNCNQPIDYLNSYVLSKKQVNDWLTVLSNQIPIINMKLQHIYGQGDGRDKFVPQILRSLIAGEDIPLTAGQQCRDFIYIKDVVSAYQCVLNNIKLFEKTLTPVHVGRGTPVSIKHFVITAHGLTNSTSTLLFGKLPYRNNEIMYSCADNSLLKSLGWEPQYNLTKGLKETVNGLH
jgi:CDP-paratose synthetase